MYPCQQRISEQFEEFHDKHPDVYEQLLTLALKLRDRGHTHYGMRALVEVVRFHRITSGKDAAGFKINNNFTPHYARLMMEREPELAGFFHTRKTVAP